MNISERGLAVIKNFEGLVLHPYLDPVGIPTIGYGTTYWPISGAAVSMKDEPITEQAASNALRIVVAKDANVISSVVSVHLNQNQFDALVSFAYNVGMPGFKSSTLLKRVNANPSDPTIRDAFMMWDKAHKDGKLVELPVLKERRKEEADLYFSV